MVRNHKIVLTALSLLSTLSFSAQAQPQIVVAPNCLIKHIPATYQTLSSNNAFSLIAVDDKTLTQLSEVKHKESGCGGFMNVTRAWESVNQRGVQKKDAQSFLTNYTTPRKSARAIKSPYAIHYQTEVNQLLTKLNPQNMWNDLTTLSGNDDRYANSKNGVEAANWFKSQIETIAKNTGHDDVTVYMVKTGRYKQPSVVAKFGNSSEPGVVLGGHMDTLASSFEKKPGADDDGSGSVTTLEVARTLLSSGMHFKRPIYFIWYAAEEEGLVGSDHVVDDFKKKNIPVHAVIHFDMTGYAAKNDPTMWLMDDYVNKDLTSYLALLIQTYVKQPFKHTVCGYACSDHASWTQGGFPAAIAFESEMGKDNPNIHTSTDTVDALSLGHMTDYAKLGLAFAVELAEPTA